jgi:hypothetical protein
MVSGAIGINLRSDGYYGDASTRVQLSQWCPLEGSDLSP